MLAILKEYDVRMIWSDKEIWFHASDVGKVLDLINIRKVLPNIKGKYKRKFKDSDVTKGYNRNFDTHLNNRGETFIKPQAVYNISFRSNKDKAKEFTEWVCEVIEQVRTEGYYIATEKDEKWLGTREKSKAARKEETDEIKQFVEYAKSQGSKSYEKYYVHFSNMIKGKLGISKEIKRDDLNQSQLFDVIALETIIKRQIPKLIQNNIPYKQAYKKIKKLIEEI